MTTIEEHLKFREKISLGLDLVYQRLIEFKKQKKSHLVIMKGDKIVKVKPEDL
jgi:ADP-glucose pyrophosphorylase